MRKILLILTLLILVGCSSEDIIVGVGEYACETNSDCTIATLNQCTCGSGGQQIAISSDFISDWQNILNEQGTDINCNEIISDHASCYSEAKCVNNMCELVLDKKLFCSDSNAKTNCLDPQEFHEYGLHCDQILEICE